MNTTRSLLTLVFVLAASAVAIAQPGLPSDPTQAPIDGGLGLLAAAGGAYVIHKLRTPKKGAGDDLT